MDNQSSPPGYGCRSAPNKHGGDFMCQKFVLTIMLLVTVLFVSANRAETTSTESSQPQTRNTRLHGAWQLHPSIQEPLQLPEKDQWQLVINPDGTATYTGPLPLLIEEKVHADSEGLIPGIKTSTRVDIKQCSISGQWDLSDQYFSIVTNDPSIHRFHVQAITADKLVLEPDLGYGSSGKMFWVRIPKAQ